MLRWERAEPLQANDPGPAVAGAGGRGTDLTALRDGQVTGRFTGDPLTFTDMVFAPLIAGRSAVVAGGSTVYSIAVD